LVFYGWWNPAYLVLILFSMFFNYLVGSRLAQSAFGAGGPHRKRLMIAGVAVNLGLLFYFKYFNFFIDTINASVGTSFVFEKIVLPLAISFFTFQQITYLVDSYRGDAKVYDLVEYALFVTFFPQLIAGPIVHHSEMMPQFARPETFRFRHRNLAIGGSIFIIGLSKKVVLADNVAGFADPAFDVASHGAALTFFEAWGGVLAYTFQLYFDFSGYSDMAIGLGRLFGIRLPLNFNSPYKAENIIEFWRRWHMTLSRFLRDYLYIPLGGNRHGRVRRYGNLMVTMLLGGLWHGAGWTFVVWGGLHGAYLVVNHVWRWARRAVGLGAAADRPTWLARIVTFTAVAVAWAYFRADSVAAANGLVMGMAGVNGFLLPESYGRLLGPVGEWLGSMGWRFADDTGVFQGATQVVWLTALLFIAWFVPNTQQIMRTYRPALEVSAIDRLRGAERWLQWRPGAWAVVAVATLAAISLLSLNRVSAFLYFQF
jgi:D-alanyl-lipoteichoic acid acyltransferase DltB (MBOAT superfamily)